MEREKIEYPKLVLFLLIIFYGVGIIIHTLDYFTAALKVLTPLFLLSIFIIILTEEKINKEFLIYIILSYLFTFSIEVIGVKTGLIFGRYVYGENLGLKSFDVPLVIGLNWISLLLGCIGFVSLVKISVISKSILVGILMVSFDFILEQVASSLSYWFWKDNLIPIQNYIAWFLISLILSYYYFSLGLNKKLLVGRYNFIIQFMFFLALLIIKF